MPLGISIWLFIGDIDLYKIKVARIQLKLKGSRFSVASKEDSSKDVALSRLEISRSLFSDCLDGLKVLY